ncbi:MAG: DUF4234 domain-containing protein [Oscillospiraceae bacterium]|nr:DUF4234 domain-containing protein [Oscillospiraceae bacterium]
MEKKERKFSFGQIAGALFGFAALILLFIMFRMIGYYFNYQAFLMAGALAFLAVVLLMKRRDMLLLAAAGVVALMELLFGGLVGFVGAALLLFVVLTMATEYVPQARALVQKAWFVPAIVMTLSELVFARSFASLLFGLAVGGGSLLCCLWLTRDESGEADVAFDGSGKTPYEAAPVAVADGYCELFKHVLLLLITFGIWNLIWIYRQTRYLNRVKGEGDRNPVTKLLLCIFVPFYMMYWTYKSAQRVDKLAASVGVESKLTALCLILSAFVPMVAPVLLQDKVNHVIEVEQGKRAADFDPASRPVVMHSVPLQTVTGYCDLFKHLLLLMITCGIWNLIWVYKMTEYLNRVEGEEPRVPVNKLLLYIFVPFYAVYWIYKSSQRIDKLASAKGVRSELSVLCLVLCLVVGLVPQMLMQGKINEIIEVENGVEQMPEAVSATEE